MNQGLSYLIREAVNTLRDPRTGARLILGMQARRIERWQALTVVALLSAIFGYVSLLLTASLNETMTIDPATVQPITLALGQYVGMLAMVYALYLVGRQFGGTGSLDDSILLIAWSQFLLVVIQILQILVSIVMPLAAVIIGLLGIFRVVWVLMVFVSELHGFKSMPAIFVSVLAVALGLALGLRFVFNLFGFNVMGIL